MIDIVIQCQGGTVCDEILEFAVIKESFPFIDCHVLEIAEEDLDQLLGHPGVHQVLDHTATLSILPIGFP